MVTWIDRLIFVLPPYHLSGQELAARRACTSRVYTPVIPPLASARHDKARSKCCFLWIFCTMYTFFLQLKLHTFSKNLFSLSKASFSTLRRGDARGGVDCVASRRRCPYCSAEFPPGNYVLSIATENTLIRKYFFDWESRLARLWQILIFALYDDHVRLNDRNWDANRCLNLMNGFTADREKKKLRCKITYKKYKKMIKR